MFKNKKNLLIALICAATLGMPGAGTAGADRNLTLYHAGEEDVILKPGWVTSCHTNFVLENLGDESAEVAITLGIEEFSTDRLGVWGKRNYNLRENLSFAKQLGKSVTMDDVALVRNHSASSNIRVHC